MKNTLEFPRYLDAPQQILFWTVNQIAPLAVMALIGMATGTLAICLVFGGVIAWAYARFIESRPDGYLQHITYWYGVLPLKGRAAINPFHRRIYPQ